MSLKRSEAVGEQTYWPHTYQEGGGEGASQALRLMGKQKCIAGEEQRLRGAESHALFWLSQGMS